MKLKNAPERKRQRQLGALGRLEINLVHRRQDSKLAKLAKKEIRILKKRTEFSRRVIRTKKDRGI